MNPTFIRDFKVNVALTSSEMLQIRGGGDGGETRDKDIFDFVDSKREDKIENMVALGKGNFSATDA